MLKPIEYIEVTLDKRGIKQKGLFLHYDETTQMIRLIIDCNNTTGSFSLTFAPITSILIKDSESTTSSNFSQAGESQKLAIELILEASHQLKKDNRLNASGFVNIASYKDVPHTYRKMEMTNLPVVTNSNNLVGTTNHTTVQPPKINFLVSKPTYYVNNLPAKKIAIIFRKSELPTDKMLKTMSKRVSAASLGTYKIKAKPLSEVDIEPPKTEAQEYLDAYGGDYDDFTYAGMHGRMM